MNNIFKQTLNCEKDVEIKLLEPLLLSLGLSDKDYQRQLKLKAGRQEYVYPDYALHCTGSYVDQEASIIIEAKYHINSNKDLDDAFSQAYSYAKLLNSKIIILCDKCFLYIYKKQNSFSRESFTKYYWQEMTENQDAFRDLQNTLCKTN